MNEKLLKLVPKAYLCPICGQWHEFKEKPLTLGAYDSNMLCLRCDNYPEFNIFCCYFQDGRIYIKILERCYNFDLMYCCNTGIYHIERIKERVDSPRVIFQIDYSLSSLVDIDLCKECPVNGVCALAEQSYKKSVCFTIGFEFHAKEYFAILGSAEEGKKIDSEEIDEDKESEEIEKVNSEEFAKIKEKENNIMTEKEKNNTSIKAMLYEKSPKENLELLKSWSEKYKPTLRWAIPMVAVYAAYRILNSNQCDISVNNIADVCQEKLGFKLELLEDKKVLKELMVLGGISAGAYGTVKAVSAILGTNLEKDEDISVKEVESEMDKLETISKKFAWMQPKMEPLMPVAFSVVAVYLILHKPKLNGKIASKLQNLTEDWQVRIGAYLDLAKLFVQDKFGIDLSNEEEQKKARIIAILALMIAIFAFLYGKKVLSKDEAQKENAEDKSVEAFVEQCKKIIKMVAPALYTTLISLLVSKKILQSDEIPEIEDKSEENPESTVVNEPEEPKESEETE